MYYEIKVFGRVQGVFCRRSTMVLARSLHLKGFVQNMPDGSVRILVELPEDKKFAFLDGLYFRDDHSIRVESIDIKEISQKEFFKEIDKNINRFYIKY